MKFQFQSDIHLEVGNQYKTYTIPPSAPYLILAGDVGNLNQYDQYRSFLQVQCQSFTKVFLVLGNHEFYNTTRQQGIELAERLTTEPELKDKLILLHRRRYDLDENDDATGTSTGTGTKPKKVTILGCTLNSHIQEQNKLMVRMKVSDFSKIQDWTPDMHNAEHDLDTRWLRNEIEKIKEEQGSDNDRKILVVTHHVPFRKGCAKPEHEATEWHDAFATDLLESNDDGRGNTTSNTNEADGGENVLLRADAWIFGHTHYTTSCRKGGVLCLANQRGYVFPWEMEKTPTQQHVQAGEQIVNDSNGKKQDDHEIKQHDDSVASGTSFTSKLLRKIVRSKRMETSFKVKYPGPRTGNQGDGDLSFDPAKCIDI